MRDKIKTNQIINIQIGLVISIPGVKSNAHRVQPSAKSSGDMRLPVFRVPGRERSLYVVDIGGTWCRRVGPRAFNAVAAILESF